MSPETIENLIYTAGFIIGGVVVVGIVRQLIKTAVKRVDDGDDERDTMLEQRARTVGAIANNTAGIVVWGIVITMALSRWGVNIAPILAGAGVVGLAVGFGAQSLVKDIVTGFFILFENYMNVGDKVEIAGKNGTVVSMNLRTTVLHAETGETIIIPNSKIDTIVKLK
jgi:moderate conductance mechanosensitive channel